MSPIPPLDERGHLPIGRYTVTLDDVRRRFVDDDVFANSSTREALWQGLTSYLALWRRVEDKAAAVLDGRTILMSVWLGGSFISAKDSPSNVDLTIIANGDTLDECDKCGIKSQLSELAKRESMTRRLGVTPTILKYRWFRSPWDMMRSANYTLDQRAYAAFRGSMDDWWLRARRDGEAKSEPTMETGSWRRGYLEVIP
ncbi:hypothetical protein Cme02nite_15320 [Catellatospora methionotrophica]|uniref:Uncharacterized protein n=1 Tax=Catellatospora methionotrophica TaxID=121620 RepID=A0A8J3LIE5_9ACTN|nr:hypothetical protein [Catellatospora methionotrophica]GIG13200.1 hypothetical protein Cme02nite_15320 [Catellatospora methionotrophica]